MKKIETTTRELHEGVALDDGQEFEVKYESTGHLSVRLLDASGVVPLAGAKISVEIPEQGKVELTAGKDGKVFHADVPFQEYALTIDAGGESFEVEAPAVASRKEVHDRHVPAAMRAFLDLELREADARRLAKQKVTLEGGGETLELETDAEGRLSRALALPPGTYKLRLGERELDVELPATRTPRVAVFPATEELE